MAPQPVAKGLPTVKGLSKPKVSAPAPDPSWQPPVLKGSPLDVAIKKQKPRSLWEQATDVATGVLPGIVRFGGELATSTVGMPVRAAWRAGQGKPINFKPGSEEWNPTGVHAEQSFGNTYGDIVHPSRFVKAVKNGTIIDKVLEDLGNFSLVAGPAAQGLSAAGTALEGAGYAGLATVPNAAATVAKYVHSVAGPIADSPIALPRRALTFLDEGTRTVLAKAAEGSGPFADTAASLRNRAPTLLTDQGRSLGKGLRDVYSGEARANARVRREFLTKSGMMDPTEALRPTMAEQGAATAILSGVGDADQILRMNHSSLTPEQVRLGHVPTDFPEQTYTADIADVVRQYQDGSLPIDARDRLERYMEAVTEIQDKQTARGLAGAGRFKGPIDPRWLGNDALDEYVTDGLEQAGVDQLTIDDYSTRRGAGETWDDIEAGTPHPELTRVLDNPQSYPKKWRPAMRAMALGNANLGSNLGFRPADLMGHGMESPRYFSSARSELPQPRRFYPGGERTNLGAGGFKGLSSENRSLSSGRLPYSGRTLAESVGREAGRMEFNKRMAETLSDTKIPAVRDVLGAQETADLVNKARREAKALRMSKWDTRQYVGQQLQDALEAKGHSPVIGDLNNPKPGEFDFGATVKAEDIREGTPAVESAVKEKLTQRWANKGGAAGAALDWGNKKFKGNVLPFSVRWQLGDMIGGGAMAWAGGGVNPLELGRRMRQLGELDPYASEQMFQHHDFADASLTAGEHQHFTQGDLAEPRTPIGKFKQGSFKFNAKINELNRHAYVLSKLDKLLAEHDLSVGKLGGDEQAWAKPEVQQALQSAVDDAMKVMGDFNDMSPFEQRVMKRAFPFYAWTRHITGLVAHMALDNPKRLLWTMRAGSFGSDPDFEGPDYLKGGIPLPGGFEIPTGGLNPFSDVIGGEPPYTPSGAMRSMSPMIKLAAAAAGGYDLNKSGAQLSAPGRFGVTKPRPLIGHPLEMAYNIANVLPVSRTLINELPTHDFQTPLGNVTTGPVPRYGSGARMTRYPPASRISKLFPLVGLPLQKQRG